MSLGNVVKVAIIGDERELKLAAKEGVRDLKNVGDEGEKSTSKLGKFASVAGAGIAGGLAVGVAAMGVAIKAGDELNESTDQLKNAVEKTGGSWATFSKGLSAAQSAGEKLGYTNAEINDGLSTLTTATGSSKKALSLLALAQDVAAKTGKPLKDSAIAVAKASEGQLRPLKALGIDLPIAAGGALKVQKAQDALTKAQTKAQQVATAIHAGLLTGTKAALAYADANAGVKTAQENLNDAQHAGTDILKTLTERVGGSAAIASDSLAGKTKALHAKFADFTAHIGQALIPILLALVSFVVDKLMPALGRIWDNFRAGIPVVVAFGNHIVEMYERYIAPTVNSVVEIFKGLVKQISGIFDLIRDIFTGKWSNIGADLKRIVSGIVEEAEGLFFGWMASIGRLLDNGAKLLGRAAGNIGSGIVHAIASAVKGGANLVIGIINDVIDLVDGFQIHIKAHKIAGVTVLPGFDWNGLQIPHIPTFHSGGLADFGSAGEGLAILRNGERVLTPEQQVAVRTNTTVMHLHGAITPSGVNAIQTRHARRNGLAQRSLLDNSSAAMGAI